MRPDPLHRAAHLHAIQLSAEVEVQLNHMKDGSPLLALLAKGRQRAAAAIMGLADADPEEPKVIRALQNEIKCFDLIVEWLTAVVTDGKDADRELSEEDRELAEDITDAADDAEDHRA